MNAELDFKNDIKINRFKLDIELEHHSSLYWLYSNELAEHKNKLAKVEEQLKLRKAEIELEIRNCPEKFLGDVKATEGAIKAGIIANEELVKLTSKVRVIQADVVILEAGVRAFEHRKNMLGDLVTLHMKNYYSDPSGNHKVDVGSENQRKNLNKKRGK